jgi:hypothetical protein
VKFIAMVVACGLAAGVSQASAAVLEDNFSDNNDTASPAWTHLSGYVGSSGQAWDASGGVYRFTAPNNGAESLGFIGSYTGAAFADGTVAADIVSFQDDPVAQGGVFGVGARFNGANGPGQLTGYGYAYEPFAASGVGEMVLYKINSGIDVDDLGAQPIILDPAKDYRLVLEVVGDQLHGQVIDLETGEVVAERTATDATYASGYSGLFAYSQDPIPPVDVSWDNFAADIVPEPGAGLVLGLGAAALLRRRRQEAGPRGEPHSNA